jgi:hypothetical protein
LSTALPWLLARIARRFAKRGVPRETPKLLARSAYLNGIPLHRRRFMNCKLYAESLRILAAEESRQWESGEM